jgi:hypothetical protein
MLSSLGLCALLASTVSHAAEVLNPPRERALALSTSAGLLLGVPLVEVDLRVVPHLSVYGNGEYNLAFDGGALQVGARGYLRVFDGPFLDVHVRFAEYKNWLFERKKRSESGNPGVALGWSHLFSNGLVISGSAGLNFLGELREPRYQSSSCGAGSASGVGVGLAAVVCSVVSLAEGHAVVGYGEPQVGLAPELRLNVGYVF